jgi:hypothetical protein
MLRREVRQTWQGTSLARDYRRAVGGDQQRNDRVATCGLGGRMRATWITKSGERGADGGRGDARSGAGRGEVLARARTVGLKASSK